MKRNQHPLTYQEAYSLLTQLVGGDVLNACHSANIHWNAYNMEEDGFFSNNHPGERNGNNQRGNQKGGRGGKGKGRNTRAVNGWEVVLFATRKHMEVLIGNS